MAEQVRVAFVLGGGGHLGAAEVGMLKALVERDIRPDLVVGTSIGAVNGAFVAAAPDPAAVARLEALWRSAERSGVLSRSPLAQARNLLRTGVAIHSADGLRALLLRHLPVTEFAEMQVPFECVATCIERAAEPWFVEGSVADAVVASAATPGLFAPVPIGGEHFFDGGIVNSIPVSRAVEHGATCIYVIHVGRIERALAPPTRPWQVGWVAFELARRHRLNRDLAALPAGVEVHLLPTGRTPTIRSDLRYWDLSAPEALIQTAHAATSVYLDGLQS
jgi:NTE family protein